MILGVLKILCIIDFVRDSLPPLALAVHTRLMELKDEPNANMDLFMWEVLSTCCAYSYVE